MSLPTEVDASEHYSVSAAADDLPTHLCVIIDTNPRAWHALSAGPAPISIHKAVASLVIFINAHLAYSNTNQLTVLAAHPTRHVFLWPPEEKLYAKHADGDVVMQDAGAPPPPPPSPGRAPVTATPAAETVAAAAYSANKLDQFAQVESTLRASIISLMTSTSPADLATSTPQVSGALMRALFRINKARVALSATSSTSSSTTASAVPTTTMTAATTSRAQAAASIRGRILVLSVSDSDAKQYQQIMNAAKGANNQGTPIDVLCLAGKPTLLQQAAAITDGSFVEAPSGGAHGLLAYLMHGFALDSGARDSFVLPSNRSVDFRGSCLCHSRFVDVGFICSNCLSVFCEPPADQVCLMCETKLALGSYGGKPALIPRRKKKRKRAPGADGGSGADTPTVG